MKINLLIFFNFIDIYLKKHDVLLITLDKFDDNLDLIKSANYFLIKCFLKIVFVLLEVMREINNRANDMHKFTNILTTEYLSNTSEMSNKRLETDRFFSYKKTWQ